MIAINNQPDGRNINLNCGSLHIEGLQQQVIASGATLGVAFDGDADRALFVDAEGEFVDGDATLWVLANNLHSRGELKQELVVATVMSNIGLEIALRSRDLKLVRTDVGDKYVRRTTSLGRKSRGRTIRSYYFPKHQSGGRRDDHHALFAPRHGRREKAPALLTKRISALSANPGQH